MPYSYDTLYQEACAADVEIVEKNLRGRNKGFYGEGLIVLDARLLAVERICILAEELGHHHTTAGDILDQSNIRNRKQELYARQWAYRCLIPFNQIIEAHKARISGRYDLADYLNVTEEFLQAAIDRYTSKYGLYLKVDERYAICFDPLGVLEIF